MTGWILLLAFAAALCAASACGLVELHWNKFPRPGPVLARWLRQLSDHLDAPSTPGGASSLGRQEEPAPDPQEPAEQSVQGKVSLAGTQQGWYRVLRGGELISCINGAEVIDRIAKLTRLSRAAFDRDLLPLLHRYIEFVQLMPASESHHHANAGGLAAHTLETILYALKYRNGFLLPRGAGAERIDAERDFWTYAVFLGALLHDVGKPITDLRIKYRRKGTSDPSDWVALAGTLVDCGAYEYHIAFAPKGQRDYAAHSKLGASLLQAFAPTSTLSFLSRAPSVLRELNQYLVGGDPQGVIAEIVKQADQESTRRNLASGSRIRLNTASSVPLIEQLMGAIRDMLNQGTELPINRDGSAGWVYDGSVWFVAKRLADNVRNYIRKNAAEDADGVPGESKNDRLFDTWQEYGCIMPNPQTGQAIWYVLVTGTDADGNELYRHKLSVLRFPLAKLYDSAEQYPPPLAGAIEVISKDKADGTSPPAVDAEALPAVDQTPGRVPPPGPPQRSTAAGGSSTCKEPGHQPLRQPEPKADVAKVPVPKFAQQQSSSRKLTQALKDDVDQLLDEADSARAEARKIRQSQPPGKASKAGRPEAAGKPVEQEAKTVPAGKYGNEELELPPVEELATGAGRPAQSTNALPGSERLQDGSSRESPPAAAAVPRPVVLPSSAPPSLGKAKEPSLLAIRFIEWLQAGLAEGSIKHNELHAPVHFVEQGMALVSPLIFREYAAQHGESLDGEQDSANQRPAESTRLGLVVQREVIRAAWHAPAPGGLNVWAFQVKRKGSGRASRLSAVVLRDPQRWVMPVPPPNPYLTVAPPADTAEGGSAP